MNSRSEIWSSPRRARGGRHERDRSNPTGNRGFTLTEVMITVVIVAIIAAVAVPAYQGHVQKTRRATGQSALSDLMARQEQFFLDNKTYTQTVGAGGLGGLATTEGGYYALSVDAPTAGCPINRCYVLRAAPQAAQAGDTCGSMTLGSGGDKTPANCW